MTKRANANENNNNNISISKMLSFRLSTNRLTSHYIFNHKKMVLRIPSFYGENIEFSILWISKTEANLCVLGSLKRILIYVKIKCVYTLNNNNIIKRTVTVMKKKISLNTLQANRFNRIYWKCAFFIATLCMFCNVKTRTHT